VQKIKPGLWRWTALHPEWTSEEEWGEEVGCLYQETEDAVTLIDPLIPPEDSARFLEALDRDVARAARPVHILITIFWHARSAATLVERYPGTRVWVHEPARELVEERAKAGCRQQLLLSSLSTPPAPGRPLEDSGERFGPGSELLARRAHGAVEHHYRLLSLARVERDETEPASGALGRDAAHSWQRSKRRV
jgi:glyoxylase-like metal-dependent hydrolase (beta-lactamase superfamily II)